MSQDTEHDNPAWDDGTDRHLFNFMFGGNTSGQAPTLAKLVSSLGDPRSESDSEDDDDPDLHQTDAEFEAEFSELLEAISDEWLGDALRVTRPERRRRLGTTRGFERRLRRVWGHTFVAMHTLGELSYQIGAELNQLSTPTTRALRYVLLHQHGRACQIYSEITLLLERGYADGAHARWRSLYELAAVSVFLSQHGDRGALLFLEHEAVENHKGSEEYQKHAAALNYEPLEAAVLDAFQAEHDAAIAKHGPAFKGPYGWAAVLLDKPRFGIEGIADQAGLGFWRPLYRMASWNIHPNSKLAGNSLAQPAGVRKRFRLAGPSNAGLADPAHASAIALMQVTASLLKGIDTIDSLALIRLISGLADRVGDEAIRAHRIIESHES